MLVTELHLKIDNFQNRKLRLKGRQLTKMQSTTKNCFIPIIGRKKTSINCIIYINHEYLRSRQQIRYFQDFYFEQVCAPRICNHLSMESKLTLHFFSLVTFVFLNIPLLAQGESVGSCEDLYVGADIISACVTGNRGQIILEITSGQPPYSLTWEDGSTRNYRKEPAGTYEVTVTDALGCMANAEFTIGVNSPIETIVQVNHTTKQGKSNGAIALSVNGGAPPYRYTWISSSQGVLIAALEGVDRKNKLPSGKYQILIFDSAGCYSEVETEVN